MQNKYVGDVGDFVKLGILQEISKHLKLGVNWYFVEDNLFTEKNNDGRHIEYLLKTTKQWIKYKQSLPELYQQFSDKFIEEEFGQRKFINGTRNIKSLTEILRDGIVYYDSSLGSRNETWNIQNININRRDKWFSNSKEIFQECDILFLDPDNSIRDEEKNMNKGQKKAAKYTLTDEALSYAKDGKSLIIYNHRNRESEEIYNDKLQEWKSKLNQEFAKFDKNLGFIVLRSRKYQVRDFIFVVQENHKEQISKALSSLIEIDFLYEVYCIDGFKK